MGAEQKDHSAQQNTMAVAAIRKKGPNTPVDQTLSTTTAVSGDDIFAHRAPV